MSEGTPAQRDHAFASLRSEFVLETSERIARVEELLLGMAAGSAAEESLTELRRQVHTIKGNAGMIGFDDVRRIAHGIEDRLSGKSVTQIDAGACLADLDRLQDALRGRDGTDSERNAQNAATHSDSVRIASSVVDTLVESVTEIVTACTRMDESTRAAGEGDEAALELREIYDVLWKNISVLRDAVFGLRLVPLKSLLSQVRRLVHDEAASEGKNVDFVADGFDVTVDRNALDAVAEAVGHIARNAVVHGIELPRERTAKGKPPAGRIAVYVRTQGGEVCLTIEDDGGGIDFEELRRVAALKGHDVRGLSDREILFLPEVSTRAASASMAAGRGVGMSAVQAGLEHIGGAIRVESKRGVGSRFTITFPSNVSLFRSLLVECDGEVYVLPVTAAIEHCRLEASEIHDVNGPAVIRPHLGLIPIIDLGVLFGTAVRMRANGVIVVIAAGGKYRGLVVDRVTRIVETAARKIDPVVRLRPGISSGVILPDSRVGLVLDSRALVTDGAGLRWTLGSH